MAVNVRVEEQEVQDTAAREAQPRQVAAAPGAGPVPGGAMAPRPEWIAPPSQQLVPIDRDLIAEIEEIVTKEEVAQAINDIVRRELRSRRMQALLEEMAEESGGPLTPEELAWAASLPWPK